jgi:sugar/nucleoside kinase (ribokinase family)
MPDPRRGVVTGGSWCVDRNKMVEYWPGEDGLVEILQVEARGGGSGCNLALDIRKLDPGLPVWTIGLVGDDADGRLLQQEADSVGVDRTQLAVRTEEPTQYTDAYCSHRTGRRTHIFYQGTGALLTPDDFDFTANSARILHLGLPGVHRRMDGPWQGEANGWVATLKKARAAGLQTNLELCSIAPEKLAAMVPPCLPYLDSVIVNDHEIGAIAGEKTLVDGQTDVEACVRAARAVMQAGTARLVAVHFPAGAIALARDGSLVRRPSVRVPPAEVASANGAGDAFAAGFVYGMHEGWSLEASITLAHATAAASLRGLSTTGTVETWQKCLDLAERWGWHEGGP